MSKQMKSQAAKPDDPRSSCGGAEPLRACGSASATQGQFTSVGLLCHGILTALNEVQNCPDGTKATIGAQISNILSLFSEKDGKVRNAKRRISTLKRDLRRVNEQLKVLRQEHFGASSERDQDENAEDDEGLDPDDDLEDEPTQKPKGKRARKAPDDIEVVTVEHFPENMTCCGCGHELKSIKREERVGSLRIVPEHVVLVKNAYHTCACNHEICKDNKPVSAKSKNYIMKGRGIEPGFVVEAACQKFFEHIPSYRMERRLANRKVNLSRQTISRNIVHLSMHLEPLRDTLLDHVKSGYAAHMDETPVRVQAPGNGKCDIGYLWAICRDERRWNASAEPAVVYHYAHSRAGIVAEGMLEGSALRFLQTDGYGGYNRLYKDDTSNDGLSSARCWAHSRRKFQEAFTATKSPLAKRTIKRMKKMYKVEAAAAGLPPDAREALRQEKTLPVLGEIRAELLASQPKADGKLKAAINYTLNAFDALQSFVWDGRLEIDNNPVERCIRGIALTKKNSLFAGSHETAHTWAIFYSLIESARLNSVNPRSYLNWVVAEIERNRGDMDYELLMPWHCPHGRLDD